MTPEGRVKALVKRRMEREWPDCYRFMPVQNGMGAPALDFYYCIEGHFFGIETKALGKSATPRQESTIAEITKAGGYCFVVDGADSLEIAITHIKIILRP